MSPATENIATIVISGLSMVGLYWLGAGRHSFWPLMFLLNLNSSTHRC